MFYYLVDVCIVNNHIIMSESPNINTMHVFKNFVIKVAQELMTSYSSGKRPPKSLGSVPPPNHFCKRHFPLISEKMG